jgi:multicomponent Na+:H+ antiporter subunit D
MTSQLPFYVVGVPLFTALFIGSLGVFYPALVRVFGVVGMALGGMAAIALFGLVKSQGVVSYFFGGWPAPIGIAYSVDHLNALMILLIYVVSTLAFVYSLKSVTFEIPASKHGYYYTLYFLLITGLVGITITGDAFNLYVLFEICALSSYALLAMGGKRSYLATFFYLLVGSIGACFYLLGVAYLFIKTGTLNIAHLFELIPPLYFTKSIVIAFIFVNLGLFIKMAMFPLHSWLPSLYSKAPVSTTCLLAPLGTKLSIYILLRFYLNVFSPEYVFQILNIQSLMMWLSTIAIVVGSLYAIFHTEYRKIISCIVVAEIGYIVGGIWTGHPDSMFAAIYHILADSFMTLSLFMIAGVVIFYIKSEKVKDIHHIFRSFPITAVAMIVVFLSIVGVPPTSGFFSKMYLIKGAYQMGYYQFIVALLFSSLVSLFVFFRFFESYFFGGADATTNTVVVAQDKSKRLAIPLILVSVLIIWLGLSVEYWYAYIANIIPVGLR